MLTTDLTLEEIRFLDQYFREFHLAQNGPAMTQLQERGIQYEGGLIQPFFESWHRNWKYRNLDVPYPLVDDLEVICPWKNLKEISARSNALS